MQYKKKSLNLLQKEKSSWLKVTNQQVSASY